MLTGNRLLIDLFVKLSYRSGPDRYRDDDCMVDTQPRGLRTNPMAIARAYNSPQKTQPARASGQLDCRRRTRAKMTVNIGLMSAALLNVFTDFSAFDNCTDPIFPHKLFFMLL